MAKLHFNYSVMNAGKSAQLLFARYNYEINGFRTLVFTSATDTRSDAKVTSRLGIEADAVALRPDDDIFRIVCEQVPELHLRRKTIVFIDEVQFLTSEQVRRASAVADFLNIPVLAYGLKNNVFGELFSPAVATILALADDIKEIKQVCHCGRKATMILRFDSRGLVDRSGEVVRIGAEDSYVSVCRPCYKAGNIGPVALASLVPEGAVTGPVVCATCQNTYTSIRGCYPSQQAYRCSAVADEVSVTGHYGSTVADMERWLFVGKRPDSVRSGNMCDVCIVDLRDRGAIVREEPQSEFLPGGLMDDLLDDCFIPESLEPQAGSDR